MKKNTKMSCRYNDDERLYGREFRYRFSFSIKVMIKK